MAFGDGSESLRCCSSSRPELSALLLLLELLQKHLRENAVHDQIHSLGPAAAAQFLSQGDEMARERGAVSYSFDTAEFDAKPQSQPERRVNLSCSFLSDPVPSAMLIGGWEGALIFASVRVGRAFEFSLVSRHLCSEPCCWGSKINLLITRG